jgi:hypothetical protein
LVGLPRELLLQVLRQLPQQDRLAACAVTCKALHTAAGLATQEVQLMPVKLTQQQADAVVAWLSKQSSRALNKLCLGSRHRPEQPIALSLPWQRLGQLTSLMLWNVIVPLADCSSSGSSSNVCGLGQLSLLRRLELEWLREPKYSSFTAAAYTASLGEALGQLVQLTELSLSGDGGGWLSGAVLGRASSLSQLQCLKLVDVGSSHCPVRFADLPCGLTALHLSCVGTAITFDSSSSSSWQLPLLRQLKVQDCEVPAAALQRMPQLQHFWCENDLLSDFHGIAAGLQHLQQLQTLKLAWFGQDMQAAEFAGLTASSHLTSLELLTCGVDEGAARHMFRQGQLMPQLQRFLIAGCDSDWGGDARDALEEFSDWSVLLQDGDADRIVTSCPALQSLGTLAIAEGLPQSQLLPLLQLTALTELGIGGDGCTDAVAEQLLAKMTGGRSNSSSSSKSKSTQMIYYQ